MNNHRFQPSSLLVSLGLFLLLLMLFSTSSGFAYADQQQLATAGHITGNVSDGVNSLEGVEVTAYRRTGDTFSWETSTHTDAGGNYDIGGLDSGTYRIRFKPSDRFNLAEYYADAPDLDSANDISVTIDETTAGIDAVLTVGGRITGHVTDGANPLPNIEVKVYYWDGRHYQRWGSTSTNSAGDYEVTGLPTGNYRIGFFDNAQVYLTEYYDNAPDLESGSDIAVVQETTTAGIDAVLENRGRISGNVGDGANPLPDIEVTAYRWNGNWYEWIKSVYTDTDGSYELGGLEGGTYRLRFHDYNDYYFTEFYDDAPDVDSATDLTVTAGSTTAGIDAILDEGGYISGLVSSETTPLDGAEVVAYRWTGSDYQWQSSAYSDGSGNYLIHGLPGGTYRVRFAHYNYVDEYYDDAPSLYLASDIAVVMGEITADIDADLSPFGQISGTVTDGSNPLAGIEVGAYRNEGTYWSHVNSGYTDAAGNYDIGRLFSGTYRVEFSSGWDFDYLTEWYDDAPSRDTATDINVTVGATTSGIDAELSPGGAISGNVSDGVNPLGDIQIDLYHWTGTGYDWTRHTSTDATGSYRISGLPSGTYRLLFYDTAEIYAQEYYDDAADLFEATDIWVTAGATTSDIDAILSEESHIRGTVSDGTYPLADVEITAYRWTGSEFAYSGSSYTNPAGVYDIGGLEAGTYRLRFYKYDYVTEYYDDAADLESATDVTVLAATTTTGIDAVLTQMGHITGTVTDEGGQPIANQVVYFYQWMGISFEFRGEAYTAADGSYDKNGLPAGTYRVKFGNEYGDYLPEYYDDAPDLYNATDVPVSDNSTTAGIDAILTERGHISGTVTDGSRPLAGIRVVAYLWDGTDFRGVTSTATDDEGTYDLAALHAGTYRLEFSGLNYLSEYYDDAPDLESAADVVVADGIMTTGIDAVLALGGCITGQASNGTNPVSRINVIAHRFEGAAFVNVKSAETKPSGNYQLCGLSSGTYRVEFQDPYRVYPGEFYDDAPDLRSATDVNVSAGETTANIDAVLTGRGFITIVKEIGVSAEDTFLFAGDLGGFSLVGGEGKTFARISAGEYTVRELETSGWTLDEVVCDGGEFSLADDGVTVGLQAGDDITCTFSNRQVNVKADAGGPYAGDEGAPILLDASGSTHQEIIQRYEWDCTADGSWDMVSASPQGSSCTYADDGVFTVRLRTVDIFNRKRTDSAQVRIRNVAPQANAGNDQTVMAGREVRFAGSFLDPGTADSHAISWDFGDGETQSETLIPRHIYTQTGLYTVALTVTDDDGGSDTATLTVTVVNSAPSMRNIMVEPAEIAEGERFTLSGTISDVSEQSTLSLFVDWGDGQMQTSEFSPGSAVFSLSHRCEDDPPGLSSSGYYTINLTLTDDEGAFSTSTAVVKVINLPPLVEAGPDLTASENESITFNAEISDPGQLDTHTVTWDFGDGSPPARGAEATHIFVEPGRYMVTVTAEDDDGGTGQDSLVVVVKKVFTLQLPVVWR